MRKTIIHDQSDGVEAHSWQGHVWKCVQYMRACYRAFHTDTIPAEGCSP
jgi:hypothetical protein